jgi:hypothetical protein
MTASGGSSKFHGSGQVFPVHLYYLKNVIFDFAKSAGRGAGEVLSGSKNAMCLVRLNFHVSPEKDLIILMQFKISGFESSNCSGNGPPR